MIRPEIDKWGQSVEALRRLALQAEHPRTRERFLALYTIASGSTNATQWAKKTDRRPDSVMGWVHRYNQQGPDAMLYRHSGGRRPFFQTRRRSKSSRPRRRPSPSITATRAVAGR